MFFPSPAEGKKKGEIPMEKTEVFSLNKLEIGRNAVLIRLDGKLRKKKKFADIGLVAGTSLQMEGKAPFGGLLRIKVMGSSISIHSEDAEHILVGNA